MYNYVINLAESHESRFLVKHAKFVNFAKNVPNIKISTCFWLLKEGNANSKKHSRFQFYRNRTFYPKIASFNFLWWQPPPYFTGLRQLFLTNMILKYF